MYNQRMVTKSQHTVPRLHLQHFAGASPAGQVWTYDSQSGRNWSKIPGETGTETHFYSLQREDGTQDTRIEDMLSEIETRAAPVYEDLLRGGIPQLNTRARINFAEFIAMLYARTSTMRRIHAQVHSHGIQARSLAYAQNQEAFDKLIKDLEKERGESITPELKEEVRQSMLDPSGYEIEIPKRITLGALGVADKLSPIFYNMKWSLGCAEGGTFISSDNPVVRRTDSATHHPIMGDGGFINRTAEVSFPLSPHLMLIASWDTTTRDFGAFEKAHVDGLNEIRASHSDRFLYSHVRERWISDLAAKYRESKPSVKMDGFGPSKTASTKVGRK
jgi:hypothetical protein